ncbi:ABC transporter permease [Pedobacter nutrimenti]|jgi:ABC-2 type transport system permease protein|uniref:ABC-2 type transport system permease protein n=1 Tax=Pedobacter nutrimenti TaxID=1241337 RepID=A0A318UCS0_9SPHI|nr:ABC transporter permease [Pedobacter nutrimenti]PYF73883.1 ABC-2 type transport system permease protein [Pedobacter nutrimenti]
MNKILLIIQREYLSRVKKKSFIVMTLLTPIIIAGFYGIAIYFSVQGITGTVNKIAVVNENKTLTTQLPSTKNRTYVYVPQSLKEIKSSINKSGYDYILYLPDFSIDDPKGIQLLGSKQAGLALSSKISDDIEELIRNQKLKASGIAQKDLDKLKTSVEIDTKKIADTGKEEDSSAGASTIIAYVSGILMFMFIMLYGVQVMRGVIEEKTNRIIEVMISSVKPFQLMMGKIIGIALVGLTQFILWIVLTASISTVAMKAFVGDKEMKQSIQATEVQTKNMPGAKVAAAGNPAFSNIQKSLTNLPVTKIITVFVFFFIGGYLFYSALYAAIGSAVDNETETQQFMMPVMMPLLFGYILSLSVVTNDPYGPLAFWLSVIPFTSPIAMMVRLPYGVPDWQLALSMGLMIIGFIGTVWIASRIYRVGILMYGKKASFKEMIKWFAYKN